MVCRETKDNSESYVLFGKVTKAFQLQMDIL